jgi:glyoxylate utilization-related uncharacterized protein
MQKKMLPVLLTIEGGGRTQNEEGSPGTEQFLYVLAGPLDAQIGKERYTLKLGQSLYFDATVPHHLRNTTSKTGSGSFPWWKTKSSSASSPTATFGPFSGTATWGGLKNRKG